MEKLILLSLSLFFLSNSTLANETHTKEELFKAAFALFNQQRPEGNRMPESIFNKSILTLLENNKLKIKKNGKTIKGDETWTGDFFQLEKIFRDTHDIESLANLIFQAAEQISQTAAILNLKNADITIIANNLYKQVADNINKTYKATKAIKDEDISNLKIRVINKVKVFQEKLQKLKMPLSELSTKPEIGFGDIFGTKLSFTILSPILVSKKIKLTKKVMARALAIQELINNEIKDNPDIFINGKKMANLISKLDKELKKQYKKAKGVSGINLNPDARAIAKNIDNQPYAEQLFIGLDNEHKLESAYKINLQNNLQQMGYHMDKTTELDKKIEEIASISPKQKITSQDLKIKMEQLSSLKINFKEPYQSSLIDSKLAKLNTNYYYLTHEYLPGYPQELIELPKIYEV